MYLSKKYLRLSIGVVIFWLFLMCFNHCLLAQDFFPLGIYNFNVWGVEYTLTEHEKELINNINTTYISELAWDVQNDLINFCNELSGARRTELAHDPTGSYYPVPPYALDNTLLWRYISKNEDVNNIDLNLINQFVNNVNSDYNNPYNSGLGAIRVAHQGYTTKPDHWPCIQYACELINDAFDGKVRSVAIHNVFCWDGGSSLQDFFQNVPALDVYQHEYYPFKLINQPRENPDSVDFNGDAFQTLIDDNIIGSYQLTWEKLKNSGNTHTTLEVIIQTFRCWDSRQSYAFWRRPTEAEIWLQAFLALSRNYKGVHSYMYRSYDDPGGEWYEQGLVNADETRIEINPSYNHVAQLYDHLTVLGPQLLPLTVNEAFTWKDSPHQYIQNIDGDMNDGSHRTIEVSIFNQKDNDDYFMLINRRCNQNISGVWINADPQYITITINKPDGAYQLRDLHSGELYVTIDKTFPDIKLLAGRGRVFELHRLFDNQDESWTGTINVLSNITVPKYRKLTISPAATLKFSNNTGLIIRGTLMAVGTSDQRIKFTSSLLDPFKGAWDGISFENNSGNDLLTYCDIEYAKNGLYFYGSKANPTVQYSQVTDSDYGAYFNNNRNTIFNYNTLSNNTYGIYLENSSPTLLNVSAINNDKDGLFCYNSSPKIGSIDTMFINQSQFSDNLQYGIYCTGPSGSHPTIYRNTRRNPDGGYVRIIGNIDGLHTNNYSKPNLGSSSSSPGNNSIYDNSNRQIYNANKRYRLYAKYNWWGSADGPASNAFYGKVSATPYLLYQPGGNIPGGLSPLADEDPLNTPGELVQEGEVYLADGMPEKALELFEQVIADYPKSDEVQYALSGIVQCYHDLGKNDMILPYLEDLANAHKLKKLGYLALAQSLPCLELNGEYQLALDRCKVLKKEYKEDKDVYRFLPFQMGVIHKYGLNEIDLAISSFAEFISDNPKDPLAAIAAIELQHLNATPPLFKNQDIKPVVSESEVPQQFTLYQNHPNPFNPETEIRYQIPTTAHVTLNIYNQVGQKICTLVDEQQQAGYHRVRWDGRNDYGVAVASGVYLYVLNMDNYSNIKKMALIR
jgi:tetratricopeptide (TPR) repeat protein